MTDEEGYESPEAYVEDCEGTYDEMTGLFYCTDCYVKLGCPTGVAIPINVF